MKNLGYIIALLLCCLHLHVKAQLDTLRLYTYLNSTFDHRPPLNPTPNDETTVPFWLKLLADETNDHYESTGEFGILPQWAGSLPPRSELGYDTIPAFWDAELTPFSDANFNNAVVMPLNYQQDRPPSIPYYGDPESPIDYTTTLFDYLSTEEPGIQMYIYELWPDMAPFIAGDFPPTDAEWDEYNDYLNEDYHDWFIEYDDSLVLAFPDDCVSMIPTGPAISALLYTAPFDTIPIDSLYEDDAPHGRPTIYFLAALTTYMAIHEVEAPENYVVPDIIHEAIRDNYQDVVSILWTELQNFDDPEGNSRVFCSELLLPVEYVEFYGYQMQDIVELRFSTSEEVNNAGFFVERSHDARTWESLDFISGSTSSSEIRQYRLVDPAPIPGVNFYRIKQVDLDGRHSFSSIISVVFDSNSIISFYPNPADHFISLSSDIKSAIQVLNPIGQEVVYIDKPGTTIDVSGLMAGIYTIRWQSNNRMYTERIAVK